LQIETNPKPIKKCAKELATKIATFFKIKLVQSYTIGTQGSGNTSRY